MAFLSMAMLFGMGAGIFTNTLVDTTKDISTTCNDLNDAKSKFTQVQNDYNKLIREGDKIKDYIGQYQLSLAQHKAQMQTLTKSAKKAFQLKRTSQIISFSVFIWVLIMTLLFKYFKIWDLVLSIFFGKK